MAVNPRFQAAARRQLAVGALIGVALAASTARALPDASSKVMPRDPSAASPWAFEPAMTMGPNGVIWVAANRCGAVDRQGVCTTTPDVSAAAPVWRSTDGGKTYRFVGDAMRVAAAQGKGVARAGGSAVDIAVAQIRRGGNPALVYVLSATAASSTLAISADDGKTWRIAHLPEVTLRDRPSIASSFSCDIFLAARASGDAPLTRVERYDGCQLYDQAVAAQITARPLSTALAGGTDDASSRGMAATARIVSARGFVYVASLTCNAASAACNASTDRETARVAVSRNRGVSFTEVKLPATTLRAPLDGASPISLAADDLGNVVVVAWDGSHVRLWKSRNDGATWSLARATVDAPVRWRYAAAPTAAVRGKSLVIAWYGSPTTKSSKQSWYAVAARSTNGGATFRYSELMTKLATTPARTHLGDGLRDGFGAMINKRGAAALAYTQSCEGHKTSDKTCPAADDAGADDAVVDAVVRTAWVP